MQMQQNWDTSALLRLWFRDHQRNTTRLCELNAIGHWIGKVNITFKKYFNASLINMLGSCSSLQSQLGYLLQLINNTDISLPITMINVSWYEDTDGDSSKNFIRCTYILHDANARIMIGNKSCSLWYFLNIHL